MAVYSYVWAYVSLTQKNDHLSKVLSKVFHHHNYRDSFLLIYLQSNVSNICWFVSRNILLKKRIKQKTTFSSFNCGTLKKTHKHLAFRLPSLLPSSVPPPLLTSFFTSSLLHLLFLFLFLSLPFFSFFPSPFPLSLSHSLPLS